jgi:hypothetical protein
MSDGKNREGGHQILYTHYHDVQGYAENMKSVLYF